MMKVVLIFATCVLVAVTGELAHAQNGTVDGQSKIGSGVGGGPALDDEDVFGEDVAAIGDLDGNGVSELAVGARLDDDAGMDAGALYILFMKPDGTADPTKTKKHTTGADMDDNLGRGVAALGDLDNDGVPDVAVGAPGDDDGAITSGAVFIYFLNRDGSLKASQKISNTSGGLGITLDSLERFGWGMAGIGDLDGDGNEDLAVGTLDRGLVRLLFLNSNGTVKSVSEISDSVVQAGEEFGASIGNMGDLDGAGPSVLALVVGAKTESGPAPVFADNVGAAYILFLDSSGTVLSHQKIMDGLPIATRDEFGTRAVAVGDLDGDSVTELVVSAPGDDDGGDRKGALYVFFMNPDGSNNGFQKISATSGGLTLPAATLIRIGQGLAAPGDIDGDGTPDLVAGALDGSPFIGAVYTLFLEGFPDAGVLDALDGAGIDPATVPPAVLARLIIADQQGLLTVLGGNTTVADNLELLPNEAVVVGNGSTITGNIEGTGDNTVINAGLIEGNVENLANYHISDGGEMGTTTTNGNVENVDTVTASGVSLIKGNFVNTGMLIVLADGNLLVNGSVELTTALEVQADAVLHIGGNLICAPAPPFTIGIDDLTAMLTLNGNAEGGCAGLP